MGLDIVVYKNLKKAKNPDNEYKKGEFDLCVNPNFPGREEPFEEGVYEGEEIFSFRAGSYGTYNQWRRDLSVLMLEVEPREIWDNFEEYKDKPFVELINFSDCEGTIGSVVSKKLAKDFVDHIDKIDENDEIFKSLYLDWKKAFELASKDGAVLFW